MLNRHQRQRYTDLLTEDRPPNIGTEQNLFGLDPALIGDHRFDPPASDFDIRHKSMSIEESRPHGFGDPRHGRPGQHCLSVAIRRNIIAAMNNLLVN